MVSSEKTTTYVRQACRL